MSFSTDHLSAADRERIARDCFDVTEQRGDEIHGLCPFHGENKPSFSYNIEKDVCNCFSCGAKGDLVTLWGEANGYADNEAAFKAFRDAQGLSDTSGQQPPKRRERGGGRGESSRQETTKVVPEKDFQAMPELPDEWKQRCIEKFGWSKQIIDDTSLRLWTSPTGEQRIAIPVRRDNGDLVNVRLYKPGAADNKIISWGKGFGKSKLFPAPSTWSNTVLVCEGEKDTLCALSHGMSACTQTAGCNSWDDKFTRFFDGKDVIIAYDADEKGIAGAKKVAGKLAKVAKSVRVIIWPSDIMPVVEDHGQDLTDFFTVHGRTAQHLKDLIAITPEWENPSQRAEAIPDSIKRFFGGSRGTQFKPRLVANEIMNWRQLIHDPQSGVIYSWNDRNWEEYDPANIRRQVLQLLDIEGTTPRVNDVLGIVRDLSILPHGRKMNDRENMIPLQNGMFDLEKAEVVDHHPENLNSYGLDINLQLNGSMPDCPKWKSFLEESITDGDTVRELQKFFGYCFTRETRHEKALLLIGPGGDGKGTILRVLQSLLGEINISNVGMGDLQDQFHRVMLIDKLLNVTTEIRSELFQSDMFKTIVSGEPITAAYKHRNAFSFMPVCKLAFSANKYPDIQDQSDGLYRRLMIIEMDKQFVMAGKANMYLFEELMQEKSAIFLWGLRGLQLLRDDGFNESTHMADCLDTFKQLNNPMINFARDCLNESDATHFVPSTEIFEVYQKYCKKRGHQPFSLTKAMIGLQQVCPWMKKKRQIINGNKFSGYQGVRIERELP